MSVSMSAKTDDLITRFLLGELSEQERAQVEERFLADNEFFEEVLAAEDALMDRYLRGQLSGEQLERAKTLFQSSPRQRRDVEFTKRLIASIRGADSAHEQSTSDVTHTTFAASTDKIHSREEIIPATSEPESSDETFQLIPPGFKNLAPRSAAIGWLFVSLVCFSLLSWIVYLYYQKRGHEAQMAAVERSNQETREKLSELMKGKEELSRQLEDEKERRSRAEELIAQLQVRQPDEITRPNRITSILLAPAALERGGNSRTISLKAETKRIQLQLEVGESQRYSRYSVLLSTFDGRKVWSKDSIDASQIKQGRLSLVLPSSLLEDEDYRIELKGSSDNGDFVHVADYIFKVRR
jgi:hypothetical protein